MKKLIAVTLAAASLSAFAVPAMAKLDVFLNFAPPPAPVEEVPAPRVGFVWIPGYYEHYHGNYRWVKGRWQHERHGYTWRSARWEHRGDHYYYHEGGWQRDHSPG